MDIIKFLEENIRAEILCVIWILSAWEFYLNIRQHKFVKTLEAPPSSLDGLIPPDVYQKARSYELDKRAYINFSNAYSTIKDTVLVVTFAFHFYWQWSVHIMEAFGASKDNEILASAVCMFIMNFISAIMELPLKVYAIFVLEQKHGFNKQTPMFFVTDQLKKFAVMQVLALPFLCGIIWIVKNCGDNFFFYVWPFATTIFLCMSFLYPEVIAPLFDKYTPLPDGELKQSIEALAASIDYPLYKLYVVEGSKRSSHSNAYLYGFYKNKRIVLFDTLIKGYRKSENGDAKEENQGCESDEILGVLAHELGHWKHNHVLKSLALSQIIFCLNLLSFAKLLDYSPMYAAFGFTDVQPVFMGLFIVMVYILAPVNTLMGFLLTVYTRYFEFQADQFGKQLGYAEPLKRALVKLQTDNLSYPLFDPLYSGWHHSHPPLLERLEALDKTE